MRRNEGNETPKPASKWSPTRARRALSSPTPATTPPPPTHAKWLPEDRFLEGDSPLDEERERGKTFEPRIEEIARAADRVDELYQGYMDRCYNRYAIGVTPPGIGVPVGPSDPVNVEVGRNWLLVLETPGPTSASVPRVPERNIMLVQTPQCQALWRNIVEAASGVRQAMQALLADARRQRILPGVIRELRRKHRLDWSGWDR